ncbi:calcium-binding protein [Brevundimonas sp. R86498]|uniref:calcium-binding protein n=1 Tax=Brevundimonas sp. R86498 TaxID=3093845 RepID=UPI0037C962F7
MATYTFETISAAQALGFDPRHHQLTFSTPGTSTSNIRLGFDESTGSTSITSELTGLTVIFGPGLNYNQGTVTFEDGSRLMVGGSYREGSFDNPQQGSAGRDLMIGTFKADRLVGGAGNDTLIGGTDSDVLTGGEGHDLFIIQPPQSYHPSLDFFMDSIGDWSAEDSLSFGPAAGTASNFAVLAASVSIQQAKAAADALIAGGVIDFVAAPVAGKLVVFADSKQDNGTADTWVSLSGSYVGGVLTAPTITASQIVATPAMTFAPNPELQPPAAPAQPSGLLWGGVRGNMDAVQLRSLQGTEITRNDATGLVLEGPFGAAQLTGTGFTYDANAQLTGGTLTNLLYVQAGVDAEINVAGLSVAAFGVWVATNANDTALRTLFAGNQSLYGGSGTDLIRGYGGDDVIRGGDGGLNPAQTFDSLFGGDGNDQIFASRFSQTFMRGEAGNDYMVGGDGFDNMHGNQGEDTVIGGGGNDWVVGGQGNDMLYGQVGDDIVNGSKADDLCVGGDGADIVRGGQGDDLVYGDAGNDWLSGDRGNDTLTGGSGADIFHTNGQANLDRVLDFKVGEGDRVLLDAGTTYTVYQSGADTVIDMTGGGQMVLVGVDMDDLTAGWIVYG